MLPTPAPLRRDVRLDAAAGSLLPGLSRAEPPNLLNVATTGDPGPLDPTPVTSNVLSEFTQLF